MKIKKKDAPMYMGGGKMKKMKKKEVTGVNAIMANTRGSGIRDANPVISKVTGTTSSKKGGNSGSSDEYKMKKTLKGTKTDYKGNHTRYVGMKNGGKVVAQGADKKDVRREKKMPIYMYGGKVYAEGGKMLEQMAKNPKMVAQMKAIVGKG